MENARLRSWLGTAVVAALVLGSAAGCKDNTVPPADRGLDYYPADVNSFWVYAVADSIWSQATPTQPRSVLTVNNYQFREKITGSFTDATGQPAFRLVRAKRELRTSNWVEDSVFTLKITPQTVMLTRNNLRTLELIFPVRNERLWNFNAFNNNTDDTVTAETRRYRSIGQPFTVGTGSAAKTYPQTVTTTDEGTAMQEDRFYVRTYRQVFAKGVGPVFRQRRRFNIYYQNSPSTGNPIFFPNAYFFGFSRTESLVEYGPR